MKDKHARRIKDMRSICVITIAQHRVLVETQDSLNNTTIWRKT
jgi:hypothetical protein